MPADISSLLERARDGDRRATDELLPLVYAELRELADRFLAAEKRGATLQPTALVHEAYLRLVGSDRTSWDNRAHFFGAAARAIRRILVDRARARRAARRGGGRPLRLDTDAPLAEPGPSLDVLALDDTVFAAIGASLGKGEFYARSGATSAHDGNDRIVYDNADRQHHAE